MLAAAALVLVDAGRLTLDTPLDRQRYTLRQLLQHRAGVPDYGSLAAYHEAVASGQPPWPVSELLARVDQHARGVEPGTGWTYSNVGYLLRPSTHRAADGEEIGEALYAPGADAARHRQCASCAARPMISSRPDGATPALIIRDGSITGS